MSDSVVQSFKLRCAMYDAEIRRLDASRNTPSLEFRELFLVKESLALMYQMMQLPGEALVQYEEIEALLAFAPVAIKEYGGWPLFEGVDFFGGISSSSDDSSSSNRSGGNEDPSPSASSAESSIGPAGQQQTPGFLWVWPCQEGEGVLLYSINTARMRILKNRIGWMELHRSASAHRHLQSTNETISQLTISQETISQP